MKTLVISAVNFTEGGPLTVLRDCVSAAVKLLPQWRIMVMAHDVSLIDISGVEVVAFPQTKKSWLKRVALEWWGFNRISRSLNADLWLSLHDITPRVRSRRQAVYCHNPAPFARPTVADSWFEPKYLAFSLLYGYLYRFNIHRNNSVIVQQAWLREEFMRRYGVARVIVAHPTSINKTIIENSPIRAEEFIFLYPALPRCFKNFEVIGEALEILESGSDAWSCTVRWTISGTENRYTRWLKKRFGHLRSLQWIGRQTRIQMEHHYASSNCLLFPSRVETWGLPISEAKQANLPMIVADLPYARETVGTCDRVSFFDSHDAPGLAIRMKNFGRENSLIGAVQTDKPSEPFAPDWHALMTLLVKDL